MKPTGTRFKLDGQAWEIIFPNEITKEYTCSKSKSELLELKNFTEDQLKGAEFYE